MKAFLAGAVMFFLALTFTSRAADDLPISDGEKALDSILQKFITSEEGKTYLGSVDPATIELGFRRNRRSGGWIWEWNYSKDAKSIPNPDKSAQAAMVDEIETPEGIVVHLFVSEGEGDLFVSRQRTYEISKNPRLVVGYWLKTKKPVPDLDQTLDKIIKASTNLE